MKIARCLVLSLLASCALMSRAAADSSDDGATVEVDGDGIPLSVTQPQARQPTPAEVEALQKAQAKAAQNQDWLLRAYEQQKQLHADKSDQESSDLYYRLSSNKDLASLAGLSALAPNPQQAAGFRTGATDAHQSTLTLRSDSAPAANSSPSYRVIFKPLITPLGAPEAAGLHNFYASLPTTASPSLLPGDSTPPAAPAPDAREDQDSADINTPGLIAAEKDPPADKTSANLTFDLLAHDPLAQPDPSQDNGSAKLELPLPTNAALLRKTQDAALSVPGAVKSTPDAPVKANNPLPQDSNEPTPIDQMPQPSPVRAPIANPRDIFYR